MRALITTLLLGRLIACTPPTPIGHIVHGPQPRGRVVVAVHGGGGVLPGVHTGQAEGAGGAVHADVFVHERWSIPVTLAGAGYHRLRIDAWDSNTDVHWSALGRVGFRYRLGERLTLGSGLSAGAWGGSWPADSGVDERYSVKGSSVQLDFEWSVGKRWRTLSLAFAQRFVWDVRSLAGVHVHAELSLAWYPTGHDWGFTVSTFLGMTLPMELWMGASGGVVLVL